jgi:hypothetical protein
MSVELTDERARLHPADIEAIARQVVELLREEPSDNRSPVPAPSQAPLLTARQLAERLGVDSKTVYRHAQELGGVQAGRAWRFDLANALAAWPARGGDRSASEISQPPRGPAATGAKPRRRRSPTPSHYRLLPVGHVDHAAGADREST